MSGFHKQQHFQGKLSLTPAFIGLLLLYAFAGNVSLLKYFFIAAFFHEGGHFLTLRLLNLPVRTIDVTIAGFAIRTDTSLSSYRSELIVHLAGPIASIVSALAASFFASFGYFPDALFFFSGISLIYGLFNLLPAKNLDGGRALCAFLHLFFLPNTVYRISLILHVAAALLIVLAGVVVLYRTKYNVSLLLIGIWLLLSVGREDGYGTNS